MEDKVKVTQLDSTKYTISINVPPAEVDQKTNQFFESIKSQAQIPGFRKGKAPVNQLKKAFATKAYAPVSQMLVKEYYAKAVMDADISPIGDPVIKDLAEDATYIGKFNFDNSYSIELEVEVLPKIDPVGYENMELVFPDQDEDAMFNARMAHYQEQFAERKQITDRGAQLNDTVVIDYVGYVDEQPFEGGSTQGYSIDKLGSANFVPGFEEQMVGIKTGETKSVYITFPEKYHAEHLAGKEARFEVTVHNIIEKKLSDVDNDLAMMVGFESVEELNEHVHQEIKSEIAAREKLAVDDQFTKALIEENEFDVPKILLDGEIEAIKQRINIKGALPENKQQEIEEHALYNVKRAMILEAIYDKESELEVTPNELSDLLDQHAKAANKTKDELVSILYNTNQMDSFVGVLRTAKVVDYIVDNAVRIKKEEE